MWHETNTFAPGRTTLEDFRAHRYASGAEDVLASLGGTGTEIGGALKTLREAGAASVPLVAAAAIPGPIVTGRARSAIWDDLLARLEAALPIDGLLLCLHGAMVAEDAADPESDLVGAARKLIGERPLVAVLDSHANPGEGLLQGADATIAYDTYPHVDAAERGSEGASLLLAAIAGDRPHFAWRRLPLLTSPLAQASAERPMAELLELVHAWEARPGIAAASLVPGYAYADVSRLGFTVLACGQAAEAEACAEELATAVWERRSEFQRRLVSPEEAVSLALEAPRGPVVLCDVSDNVGGGAPGDSTAVLAALLATDAKGAVLVLHAPDAARSAADRGEGASIALEVGRPAVAITGRVEQVGEMTYRRSGPYMTGEEVHMGLCAVVATSGIELILTSRRVMPFDADHVRVFGIEPAERKIVVTKAAIAWRAAFGDIAEHAIPVDSPGVCTCRLETLPYQQVPRPIAPLDEMPDPPTG